MAAARRFTQESQDVLLIWLDSNIDEKSSDCRKTITEFRRVIDNVKTFIDADECIQFIEDLHSEKTFIVISGSLGQRLLPRLHDLTQIEWFFVFCGDRKRHEQWTKQWRKVKGVFTDIPSLCEALSQTSEEHKKDTTTPLSVQTTTSSSGVSFGTVDQLDPSFMYTQILKEILSSIEFEHKHFQEFVHYCRETFVDNGQELRMVEEFENRYRDHTPVWWYTKDCFLYSMINRCLRTMDVSVVIKAGFYICDLDRQLKQLHSEQFKGQNDHTRLMLYRGQALSKVDFERLSKIKGGLISFNNFLSVTPDRQCSLQFASHGTTNPELVSILFVMKIDPFLSTTPFASINQFSYYQADNEVLFSMCSIFRIVDIRKIDGESRIFEVHLELTSDTDPDLQRLSDHLRKEVCKHSNGWYQLCRLLLKMGHFDEAQNIYEHLLEETPDLREKGNLYHQIGLIKTDQGNFTEAISYFQKTLEICKKTLPENHQHLASSYNNIGLAYGKIKEHSRALESHENALRIYQKIRPANHPDLASTFNNMGLVYNDTKEYEKALSFHEKALKIRQETLPPNHPDLGTSYDNIGLVYNNIKEYTKALSSHEKALVIRQKTLPPDHPDLARSYNNIGVVYRNLGDVSQAISSHERALEIGKRSLPANHPDLELYQKNLDKAKKK